MNQLNALSNRVEYYGVFYMEALRGSLVRRRAEGTPEYNWKRFGARSE